MKTRLALLLGSLAAASAAGRAEVEFAGYLCSPPHDLKFVLTDRAARQTSDSLGIGGSFAGYRVTAFEAKTETLTVEKDGALQQLRLKNAVLVDASTPSGRETSPATPSPDRPAAGSAQRLIASTTEAQIKLIREQQIQLSRQQDTLWQAAVRLRETLPADHPQRIAAEAELAKGAQRYDRSTLQIERVLLQNEIRGAGNATPPRAADLQAKLRDLDARIAQIGAAIAAPPPSSPAK